MKLNEDLWSNIQYEVLAKFVHHLAYYRVLRNIYNDIEIRSEFWTRTIDAHLLQSAIDWCKVFGTDSNEIHWKKVVVDRNYQSDFQNYRNKSVNMTEQQMCEFWEGMVNFRNNYAAHRTAATQFPVVPQMDTAFTVSMSYDDWLRNKVEASFDEPTLNERHERLQRTSSIFFRNLVEYGPTIDQEYEGKPP